MSKTNLELVQEVFEAKLNSLNEKIDTNNRNLTDKITTDNRYVLELLTVIKEQTLKTNGNVLRHDNEIKELTAQYHNHIMNSVSPLQFEEMKEELKQINDDNFILKIWNKYPKALVTIIVVTVLVSIATLGYTMITVRNTINEIKTVEQVK